MPGNGSRVIGSWMMRRRGAVVAGAHRRGRHVVVEDQALLLAHALVAGEEEGPLAQDRAAQGGAELLPLQFLRLAREEVARVEGVVAHEVEQRAVELVGARLGGRVQRAAGLRELGGVGALLDLELLQRVDGRLDQRPALVVVGDVGAVEHERGLVAADAADRGARDVVGADAEQVAAAGQQHRPGGEARQLVEAAAVQRQVDDLGVGDDVAEGAGLAVEERGVAVDDGALGQRADRELDVGAGRLAHLHRDRLDDRRLEPVQRHRHPVDAGVERGDDVVAVIARHDGHRDVGGGVGGDDGGAGDRRLRRVGDGADDAARAQLRGRGSGGTSAASRASSAKRHPRVRGWADMDIRSSGSSLSVFG